MWLRPDDLWAQPEFGREIGSDNIAVQRSDMRGKGASAPHCPLAEHLQHPLEIRREVPGLSPVPSVRSLVVGLP